MANSKSLAFAAKIVSFDLASASCTAVSASFRDSVDKVARLRDEMEAAFATSKGEELESDIVIRMATSPETIVNVGELRRLA